MTTEQLHTEHPHQQFNERKVVPATMSRCGSMLYKIKTMALAVLAFFAASIALGETTANNSSPSEDREAILDMIAQINHINWVVCTIKSYNNIIVLEEEYEKISPGNLDLSRIPNEETLKRITRMLDTLYSLRRDDRQMKRWREDFKERRRREQKTYLLKASKQAVDTLTEQAKECCSLWSWANNPAGSILNVAHTAFNMTHYSVSLYNDYDNFIYELDKSASDKQFDFDSAKLDLLHKQNKEILEDQWSFISRYKLDDRLRVSDVDIKILLKCLKTENHEQLYIRLLPMRERFSLFPEYWYFLSCVAMETGHFNEGIEACDTFFRVNRGIFRDDPMEGTVAFNKAFMLSKTDANKLEVRKCLERAWNNNILRGDWQLDYLVAIMYKGVFNEQAKAEMMLKHAIALIEQEMREQTHYGSKVGVTLEEGLYNCRNALHELRGEPLELPPQKRTRRIEFKAAKTGDTKTITLPGGATMEMIYVAPGSFIMGNDDGQDDEKPAHRVTLTKGFWLGKYEVTQAQWKSVMGSVNVEPCLFWPSSPAFIGEDRPMDIVSWYDCQNFIKKVNAKFGEGVARLPTEAEWEYACRAGTTGEYSGIGKLSEMGWYGGKQWFGGNSESVTHPVGQKRANHWGFHDMHGNVSEWCNDWYGFYPYGDCTDPVGPSSGEYHVRRGGSWRTAYFGCTSSARRAFIGFDHDDLGFRLCCSAEE